MPKTVDLKPADDDGQLGKEKDPAAQKPGEKEPKPGEPSIADLTAKIEDLSEKLEQSGKDYKELQGTVTPVSMANAEMKKEVEKLQALVAQSLGIQNPSPANKPVNIDTQIESLDKLIIESRKKNFAVDDLVATREALVIAKETKMRLDKLERRNEQAEGFGAVIARDPKFENFEELGKITKEKAAKGEKISPDTAYEIFMQRKGKEMTDEAVKKALEEAKKGDKARGHDTSGADILDTGGDDDEKDEELKAFKDYISKPQGLGLE